MKYIWFIFKSAIQDFSRNKGRTFLTSLGILIGVMAVVLLGAFGAGLKQFIQDQFESLGTNTLYIYPGKVLEGGGIQGDGGLSGGVRFDDKDVAKLQRLPDVRHITPLFQINGDVAANGETKYTEVNAATEEIFQIWNLLPEYGVLFTEQDVRKRSRVVVIGYELAEELFGKADLAIGRDIKIKGQVYDIIGVLESKGGGGFGGPSFDTFVYMPLRTGYVYNPNKEYFNIMVSAIGEDAIPSLKQAITDTLLDHYEEDDFSVIEQTEILDAVTSIFGVMNMVLIAIAAVSLVVGGIGIMNIMYVTVTERIKEIGIRRALGAQKSDILWQFIIESIILAIFGGTMGMGLSYGITILMEPYFPALITIETVTMALGVSSGIGIIFGVFPAKKAADLSPIEAIRYE